MLLPQINNVRTAPTCNPCSQSCMRISTSCEALMQEKIWVPGQVLVADKGLLIDTPGHERLSCVHCPDLTWGRMKDIYSVSEENMGIQHLLLLLIYLDPLCGLNANKKNRGPPRKSGKVKEVNGTAAPAIIKSTTGSGTGTALPRRITQLSAPTLAGDHDTCLGYYDVSGQYDKEFACNNTDHRYCCGSCFLRFCCPIRAKRLEQRACTNYNTPDWIKTQPPSPAPTGEVYDPALDRTNTTVYIACGVVALIVLLGISAKVAYDKATRPPQEMNVHRALADILRQQGPVPISQYEQENMGTIEGSPKESSTKNHYTPIHNKTNHGHHGKDNFRSGQDMHNFISSGFVTLGRGHLKGTCLCLRLRITLINENTPKAQHSVDDLGGLSWQGELDVPLSYS
ncbi:hypothetical protein NFI96_020538, partial [Prochilodus magdalenae]